MFSALGFYPVTPSVPQYALGAPLFPQAVLHLENGRSVTIEAPANSDTRRYVDALRIDGKPASRNWIGHEQLMRGARLDFGMSARPNLRRGAKPADAPYSFSTDPAARR